MDFRSSSIAQARAASSARSWAGLRVFVQSECLGFEDDTAALLARSIRVQAGLLPSTRAVGRQAVHTLPARLLDAEIMDVMSHQNVDLIRAGYEALARGEIDPVLEASDPAVELHVSDAYFDSPTYRGNDGYRQLIAAQNEVFEEFRIEPEEFLEAGERVLAMVRAGGHGRESGVEIMGRFGHLFTLRDGKIIGFRESRTRRRP